MAENQYNPVRGVFWMVVTGLLFVGVTALVKFLGPVIPAAEAAFLRYAMGLIFLIPMLPVVRRTAITKRQVKWFLFRGCVHTLGVSLWFFSMARIAIADVTALNYLSPVYVTVGAALFLGEKLAMRRIFAVIMALVGALIILRPGFREVELGHIAMVVAAVFFAASYLTAKQMADETRPEVVLFMLSVFVTIGLAPLAFANWVTPSWSSIAILFCVAALATAGHYTMTLAFKAAPVTVTQPVSFLQLVWAVALGTLVFNEALDVWVVLGGIVILGSVTFITWREAVLKRRAVTPVVTATKF